MSLYFSEQQATIALNGTVSSEVNLGATCDMVRLELPALTSGTISLQGAAVSGGTFRTIGISDNATAATTGDCFVELYCCGLQYIKIVSSGTQTVARTINAVGIKL